MPILVISVLNRFIVGINWFVSVRFWRIFGWPIIYFMHITKNIKNNDHEGEITISFNSRHSTYLLLLPDDIHLYPIKS